MSETPNWTESKGIARGTIVGRYVVVRKLGALTARTYEAYDPEHDRKVALKVVRLNDLEDERLRFRREAQRLTELSHPNIVGIHDVGTFGEHAWLAMGFVQGCRMREWFDSSRGWREVLGVLRDAGEALAAAHRFGILHGDFNPHFNVRIGDDGRARVQGFMCMLFANGPVTLHTDTTGETGWVLREDPLFAPPHYMGPEYLVDRRIRLTTATDQYAFCVTLWEALYGERPFYGPGLGELITNIIDGKRQPPPEEATVPAWLRRACERGLAVDPKQRWPSMDALLEALAEGR